MIKDLIHILPRRLLVDQRGRFIKCMDGHEKHLGPDFGEIYVVTASRGERRGDHYHREAAEWFTAVAGEGKLVLGHPVTGERLELPVSGDAPSTIRVPAGVAHAFIGGSDAPLVVIAYSDRRYDPADTVPHPLTP